MFSLLALGALASACASVSETHTEQETLIRELARRPASEEAQHLFAISFDGVDPMARATLAVHVTEEVTCHDDMVDIYEEQRHTTRTLEEPLYTGSFALGAALLGACSGLHVAGVGCVSPADEEDGTPAPPYTRTQHNAAAISFGVLGATALGVFVVDLLRARDSVEVLDRKEVVRHRESAVCRRGPLASVPIALSFADASITPLTATTDASGTARFDLSTLVASEHALWHTEGLATLRSAAHEESIAALPASWQDARRAYFEEQAWERATTSTMPSEYIAFLERYPQSAHAKLAHTWLLPTLEERGQPEEIALYLERYPQTSRAKLERRYIIALTAELLARYPDDWRDTQRTRALIDEAPAFARRELSVSILSWHHDAFTALDATDFDARWEHALALWKLGDSLDVDAASVEAPAVAVATREVEAITAGRSARPITPLIARLVTLHEQARAEVTRQGFARTLLAHERALTTQALEDERMEPARVHAALALAYAGELGGPDEALLTLLRRVDDALARGFIAQLPQDASYDERVEALSQALALAQGAPLRLELMRGTIDPLAATLLQRIVDGEGIEALVALISESDPARDHLVDSMVDEMIAVAIAIADADIAGNVTSWRAVLDRATGLAGERAKLVKRIDHTSQKLEGKLRKAYPLAKFDAWYAKHDVLTLYPVTHEDAEEVLSSPRGHKDARLVVSGKVQREVGGQYIFETERGSLLFIKARGKTAARTLSSSRPMALYIVLTGTIAYEREGRSLTLATADAIIGVR